MRALSRRFWSKTSNTCCISTSKTPPHALSKTFSLSLSVFLSLPFPSSPSLSLSPSVSVQTREKVQEADQVMSKD